MENIQEANWNAQSDQLQNDALRRKRDEDLRDDDVIGSDRIAGAKPRTEDDDDDANLSDDDLGGRDLDIENGDEWDEADMEDELDDRDLEDDDEVNARLPSIKNDRIGSMTSQIESKDPDETPEEQQTHNTEYGAPSEKEFGVGAQPDREFDYKERKEVEIPNTEGEPGTRTAAFNTFA